MTYHVKFKDWTYRVAFDKCEEAATSSSGFFYQIWFYTILHGLAKFKICFFSGFISLGPKCDTAPSLRTNAAFYSVRCWTDLWHWAVAEAPILRWARKHHWPISLVANVYEREGADVRPVSARAGVSASR